MPGPRSARRIALVSPRYGPEIVGGAETLIRDYAERLSARHRVTVLTTCARNHFTWANELPAGRSIVNGIPVDRFPVTVARDTEAMSRLQPAIDGGFLPSPGMQREWVMNTGFSRPLLDAIEAAADQTDVFLFAPYLFASTVFGAAVRPEKSVIIPCLHDEAYARFAPIQNSLRGAAGLIFNTNAERALATTLVADLPPSRVVGAGFDTPSATDAAGARSRHNLPQPLITHAGRLEAGKNFPLLVEYTALYGLVLSRSGPITLAAMGRGRPELPGATASLVRLLGFVSHGEMLNILAAGTVTATLSLNESFSYLIMESWLSGVPVLVHADCAVTREHCQESGGGLWVRTAEEFAEAIERCRGDGELTAAMGASGRRYVLSQYSWQAVLDRLDAALSELIP